MADIVQWLDMIRVLRNRCKNGGGKPGRLVMCMVMLHIDR